MLPATSKVPELRSGAAAASAAYHIVYKWDSSYLSHGPYCDPGVAKHMSPRASCAFAHAVMISAGFCHLLGDAIETLTQTVKYPLAPFLCACGFLSTLLADQIVEGVTSKPPSHFIPVSVRSLALQICSSWVFT